MNEHPAANESTSKFKLYRPVIIAVIAGVCAIAAVSASAFGLANAVNAGVSGFERYKMLASGGITATGSANKVFKSDQAIWGGSFTVYGSTTQEAYEIIKRNAEVVEKYLLDNGVENDELTFFAVEIAQQYRTEYTPEGNLIAQYPDGYNLTQRVRISSPNVDKIEEISRDITSLISDGIDFYSEPPEYYYTELDALKLEMIQEATQNAKARVDMIAENSNSHVGKLLNANLGVFQITAWPSAEEFTSMGTFNTDSIWKTASVTVKLYYAVG